MEPSTLSTAPINSLLSNPENSSETASSRQTPFYSRFTVEQPESTPGYFQGNGLPLLSQRRDFSPNLFGKGVSSVYDVSRNLYRLPRTAFIHQAFPPNYCYPVYPPALPGFMPCPRCNTPYGFPITGDINGGNYYRVPCHDTLEKKQKVTSESKSLSQPADSGKKKHKRVRTYIPEWKHQILDKAFYLTQYPSIEQRAEISSRLQMTEKQVTTWFQNRRTRNRKLMDCAREYHNIQPGSLANATRQDMGRKQVYRLLSERGVKLISATASSPRQALQKMYTAINDGYKEKLRSRPPSPAVHSQYKAFEPEPLVAISGSPADTPKLVELKDIPDCSQPVLPGI